MRKAGQLIRYFRPVKVRHATRGENVIYDSPQSIRHAWSMIHRLARYVRPVIATDAPLDFQLDASVLNTNGTSLSDHLRDYPVS